MKDKLITICREIADHKYTWGTGYRSIIKLLDMKNCDCKTDGCYHYIEPESDKLDQPKRMEFITKLWLSTGFGFWIGIIIYWLIK